MDRFERFGDVDEYNSPTYDGIDLFAFALWTAHPPTPTYERSGAAVLAHLGARISTLYHPRLGAMCGPYIRAYGLDLQRYVSLVGIWLHIVGESPTVDPADDARPGHGARPRPVLPAGDAATRAPRSSITSTSRR